MPVESDSDRLAFLDADEFGVSVTYTPAGGAALDPFPGIFDAEHQLAGLGGVDVASVSPQVMVRETDLPAGYGDGDEISIGAVAYIVRFPEPDGTGMVTLRLEKIQ